MTIDIAKQFSRHPAGRVPSDGPDNGERFRNECLVPALLAALNSAPKKTVVVDIDGCRSFGSSFLEESFGGLARVPAFPFPEALKILSIRSSKPHLQIYKDAILGYLDDAKARAAI
ncbi:STAS-like domain-containing protein [Tritonibacter mobilis]|uniref:STAS-like domain-containing protein n=1 Tax=Tritonibacter mobilis TaxID=379347 RepID=UPI0018D50643|nr:STAS-like domain-containing protein [Tritonibacter mobilis]